MGIPAILAAAMNRIAWGEVANFALQHGPDIVRRIKRRLQARTGADGTQVTIGTLNERIRELETALVKQEELIEQQSRNIELLERIGKTLQARLNIFMAISALSAVGTIVLLILLLTR